MIEFRLLSPNFAHTPLCLCLTLPACVLSRLYALKSSALRCGIARRGFSVSSLQSHSTLLAPASAEFLAQCALCCVCAILVLNIKPRVSSSVHLALAIRNRESAHCPGCIFVCNASFSTITRYRSQCAECCSVDSTSDKHNLCILHSLRRIC